MNNKNNKLLVTVTACFALAAIIFTFLKQPASESETIAADSSQQNTKLKATDSAIEPPVEQLTIANKWQWQAQDKAAQSTTPSSQDKANKTELPFTEQTVYYALRAVKVDQYDQVILDHNALISLDEALERIYGKLDEERLEILKEMIQNHLPGTVGEQTAQLVEDYTKFLYAKDEFSRAYEQIDPQEVQSLATLARDEALYQELQSLRELYLGAESTDKLFKVSDANARFMFETLRIDADESLSPQERSQRIAQAQLEHTKQTIDIPNWSYRYDSFLAAKQTILEAAISDAEKQTQLSSLLSDRFNEKERGLIEHLALDYL